MSLPRLLLALSLSIFISTALAQPDPDWSVHDRNRPQPPVVTPPTPSSQDQPGDPPSDAVILFDGKGAAQWVSMDGSPARWLVKDGVLECVKGTGHIRTVQNFGDCQLHIEWAAPAVVQGQGQGRGNSGVFFGKYRYEVQVLDSFDNKTYSDGSAGSIYGQYPPLVNVTLPPGQWQNYDIIYTAPRFDATSELLSPARLTVFHNGVLIQNNVELTGPTEWIDRPDYQPHPEKQPIVLQEHGNPVRFRNIWLRELGKPGRMEITPPMALLDRYVGKYGDSIEIRREGDQLVAIFHGTRLVLFAESPTRFFAKTTDVQFDFHTDAEGNVTQLTSSVGEGGGTSKKKP